MRLPLSLCSLLLLSLGFTSSQGKKQLYLDEIPYETFPQYGLVIGKSGDDFQVSCKGGDEIPSLKWIKEGAKEPLHNARGILTIDTHNMKGMSRYTCFCADKDNDYENLTISVYPMSSDVTVKPPEQTLVIKYNEKGELQFTEFYADCVCNNCKKDGTPTWYHNGKSAAMEEKQNVHIFANGTLHVKWASSTAAGVYVCEFPQEEDNPSKYGSVVVKAMGYVHQKHHVSKNLMQGEDVNIVCDIHGYPTPKVTWLRDGEELTNDTKRVFLKAHGGSKNASLTIVNLEFDDRAEYTCVATNTFGNGTAVTQVRVKDKLAALWPFLGIVVEVIVLVGIIFLYEKRKAKRDAEEEANAGEQKKALTDADDAQVRQRAVKT